MQTGCPFAPSVTEERANEFFELPEAERHFPVRAIQNGECEATSLEAYWRGLTDHGKLDLDWAKVSRYKALVIEAARSGDWSRFSYRLPAPHIPQKQE